MDDLIEALNIFKKYHNEKWPTHCEHDVLYIMKVTDDEVSEADKERLNELGFIWMRDAECFGSFHYGSA